MIGRYDIDMLLCTTAYQLIQWCELYMATGSGIRPGRMIADSF